MHVPINVQKGGSETECKPHLFARYHVGLTPLHSHTARPHLLFMQQTQLQRSLACFGQSELSDVTVRPVFLPILGCVAWHPFVGRYCWECGLRCYPKWKYFRAVWCCWLVIFPFWEGDFISGMMLHERVVVMLAWRSQGWARSEAHCYKDVTQRRGASLKVDRDERHLDTEVSL